MTKVGVRELEGRNLGGGREGMWEGVGMRKGGMEGEEGRREGGRE